MYDKETLKEINNKTVTYNGKETPLHEARERQRSIERQIRRWKREETALAAIGEDAASARAKSVIGRLYNVTSQVKQG